MKKTALIILLVALVIVFYFFRLQHNSSIDEAHISTNKETTEIPNTTQTEIPTEASSTFKPEPIQEENLTITPEKSTISYDSTIAPSIATPPPIRNTLPTHIKTFADLAQVANKEIVHTKAELLNGLQSINEFRPDASESIWNGNYRGEIGWSDKAPTERLKRWPAIINLEFKRPDEASPLTCFGVIRDERLLRFTKASGKFVPLSDPSRKNYFVFRVGRSHFLQILLSDDLQGLAATAYFEDSEKGLIPISSGLFRKNKSPTQEETFCE